MSTAKNKKLSGPDLETIAAHFRLLGEPTRLRILEAVCHGPRTVGEIVAATGASQANVSKHLSLLTAGGILSRNKKGQCVFYGLKDDLTLKMCALLHEQLENQRRSASRPLHH